MFKRWRNKKENMRNKQANPSVQPQSAHNEKNASQSEWEEAFEYVSKNFGRAIEKLSER